jgi:hypothetical protein
MKARAKRDLPVGSALLVWVDNDYGDNDYRLIDCGVSVYDKKKKVNTHVP